MEDIESKQAFLRNEIEEQCQQEFVDFLIAQTGQDPDLEMLPMSSLKNIVYQFKMEHKHQPQQPQIQPQEAYNLNQEYPYQQNYIQNYENQQFQPNEQPINNQDYQQNQWENYQQMQQTEGQTQPQMEDLTQKENFQPIITNDINDPLCDLHIAVDCIKQESTDWLNNQELFINVGNPEEIKKGFFSLRYIQYTITVSGMNTKVERKFSDFEWFKDKLIDLYPGLSISPFPPSHINLKDNSPKKILYLNKFLNSLSHITTIRASQLFRDFLTLSQADFDNVKASKYDQMKRGKNIEEYISLNGQIRIDISNENDDNAKNLNIDFKKKIDSYERLTKALNYVMEGLDECSKAFKELSLAFKELNTLYKGEGNIEEQFARLDKTMEEWSNGYINEKEFFNDEFKYYFKFMQKELDNMLVTYNNYKLSKDNYISMFNKIKKTPNSNPYEDNNLQILRNIYGFYLGALLNTKKDLFKRQQMRFVKQFIFLAENKDKYIQDYSSFNKLIENQLS